MRFAIKTRPEHSSWDELRAVWLAADDVDLFESAWNWDHFYPLTGDHAGPNLEGWTMLAAMAAITRRIRVGCQVTGMIYRHPAVLANMAATVDVVSGGRLELGIGAGWNEEETAAYGMALPPLGERFDRFDEGLEVVLALLTETVADYDGRYYRLVAARCEPKPVQRPHPPVTVGGRGRRRTLRTAARLAQQWNGITEDVEEWRELRDVLHAHCAELGRDPAAITCSANVRVGDGVDLPGTAARAAAFGDAGADLVVVNLPHHAEPELVHALARVLGPLA